MRKRTDILEKKEEILKYISENQSKAKIAITLNCKIDTLNSYLRKMNIEYSGNQGGKGIKHDPKRMEAGLFIKGSSPNSRKRQRLIDDKIKDYKCELCGGKEWLGKPIPLELHHKDCNHYNNELDNLMIVCPNCHAYLHNNNNFIESDGGMV